MSEEEERRRWFASTLTHGARELREAMGVRDDVARVVRPREAAEARIAYAVAAIDDVTKAAVIMIQVDDLLKDRPTTRDRSVRLIDEALADELSLQRRKLSEALITSVAFRLTNSETHFRDYLLLANLDRHLVALRDLEDFDGCRPAFMVAAVDSIREEITAHEQHHPEVARAWYRGSQGERAGAILAGIASRYRNAITAANAAEVLALGETYGRAYAETSAALHFTPLSWGQEADEVALRIWHAHCGILGQRVLLAVQDLTDAAPPSDGTVAQLRHLDETNEYPEELLSGVTRARAAIGDPVLADGYPGIVEEIKTNQYQRDTYRVRFTSAERPVGSGYEDWFPSYWIETEVSASTRTDGGPSRPAPSS